MPSALQHVLLDQQHGGAVVAHLGDDVEHVVDDGRRQPERRLVEQHDARPRHQRPADRHHLLLAARQLAGRLAALVAQDREQAVDPLERLRPARRAPTADSSRARGSPRPTSWRTGAALPARARCRGCNRRAPRPAVMSAPSKRSVPWRQRSRPAMALIRVVLPAPLGPITETISPPSTSSETSHTAGASP